ncbi:MAG: sugar phosphate nucleotidyltransferase [Prevotella sp.]
MKYGIIAAGEGSRLSADGIITPKPLVLLNGERLINRLIRVFMDNDAENITVICNEEMTEVRKHLEQICQKGLGGRKIPLNIVVKTTKSSMHSFFEISESFNNEPFCITTVDTVFRENDFKNYINTFKDIVSKGDTDALMGVTTFVDDEKPLYVDTDNSMNIKGFLDKSDNCTYVSGGIYGLTPKTKEVLKTCIQRGESRMRNYQRALIDYGLNIKAYDLGTILDIDHASDVIKAESFLKEK